MKKSNITGWKDVFTFTFVQTFKGRAFLISYIILLILAAVSMPLISMLTSGNKSDANESSPIAKVYVNNKTSLPDIDLSGIHNDKKMSGITFETMKEDYDTVSARIEKSEKESVILTIAEKDGTYSLDFVKAGSGPVKDNAMSELTTAVTKQFDAFKINALGITKDQTAIIHAPVNTKVTKLDAGGKAIVKKDTSISGSEYWFIYGLLFVVMMVNIMASSQIATSIVTEKSTRVIEYLLTSVKPLALMVGKTLAMLLAVLLQMISLIVVVFLSNRISAGISSGSGEDVISKYLPANIFQNINVFNIIFCLILILLGMVFYATLASLAGATVSKLEEMQEGLTLFTFTNLIGVYIGLAAASTLMASGNNGFVTFAFLFPLSSPFILPGSILIGKVSAPMIAAAIVLQFVFIILLFQFVAKVFETLILHTGNRFKIKDVIRLFKTV